jgi:hypothetical protein
VASGALRIKGDIPLGASSSPPHSGFCEGVTYYPLQQPKSLTGSQGPVGSRLSLGGDKHPASSPLTRGNGLAVNNELKVLLEMSSGPAATGGLC